MTLWLVCRSSLAGQQVADAAGVVAVRTGREMPDRGQLCRDGSQDFAAARSWGTCGPTPRRAFIPGIFAQKIKAFRQHLVCTFQIRASLELAYRFEA